MVKKKTTRKKMVKRKGPAKPIGFVKAGKSYKLVFGSKTKPKLGTKRFSTRTKVIAAGRVRLAKKK